MLVLVAADNAGFDAEGALDRLVGGLAGGARLCPVVDAKLLGVAAAAVADVGTALAVLLVEARGAGGLCGGEVEVGRQLGLNFLLVILDSLEKVVFDEGHLVVLVLAAEPAL